MSFVTKVIELIKIAGKSNQAKDYEELERYVEIHLKGHVKFCVERNEKLELDDIFDGRDEDGMTPLMWAARLGLPKVIEFLSKSHGPIPAANVTLTDKQGLTAMHHAALAGKVSSLEVLCTTEQGRKTLEVTDKMTGATPAFLAGFSAKADALTFLLQQEQKAPCDELKIAADTSLKAKNESPHYDHNSKATFSLDAVILSRGFAQKKYPKLLDEMKMDEDEIIACLKAAKKFTSKDTVREPLPFDLQITPIHKDMWSKEETYTSLSIAIANGFPRVAQFLLNEGVKVLNRGEFDPIKLVLDNPIGRKMTASEMANIFLFLINTEELQPKDFVMFLDHRVRHNASYNSLVDQGRWRALLQVRTRRPDLFGDPVEWFNDAIKAQNRDGIMVLIEEKAVGPEQIIAGMLFAAQNGCGNALSFIFQTKQVVVPKEGCTEILGKLIDALDFDYRCTYNSHAIQELLKAGADPLIKGPKTGKNVIDCAIQQGKKSVSYSSLNQPGYSELRDILGLDCIKQNSGVKNYCLERLGVAEQAKDTPLVGKFAEMGIYLPANASRASLHQAVK